MKILPVISQPRRIAGLLLVECIVYFAVFTILSAVAMAAFYLCWDDSQATISATDDIGAALRAGERWRADVRSATGKIVVETTPEGELLRIPHGEDQVFYSYHNDAIRRKLASAKYSDLLLENAKDSQMIQDTGGGVTAWRWELDLVVRHPETHLPLLFTFEATQTKP